MSTIAPAAPAMFAFRTPEPMEATKPDHDGDADNNRIAPSPTNSPAASNNMGAAVDTKA